MRLKRGTGTNRKGSPDMGGRIRTSLEGRRPERLQHIAEQLDSSLDAEESTPRAIYRPHVGLQSTIRTVTPEPSEAASDTADPSVASVTRTFGAVSPHGSPRSMPAGRMPHHRQGVVFNDAFGTSYDSGSSSPPTKASVLRPRTHTMDGAYRHQLTPVTLPDGRNRMGSFSSSGSLPVPDELRGLPAHGTESVGYPSIALGRTLDMQPPVPPKDKKTSSRRLTKRASRPTSPLISQPPSVDSLPLPIPTDDANKVLLLMKTLCGRMRGQVEYQTEAGGLWYCGIAYIEEEKGCLMFDPGENGPFHVAIVPDLRGCRVLPVDRVEKDRKCLEMVSTSSGIEITLCPVVADEFDLWLAALISWQQMRPSAVKLPNGRTGNVPATARPELKRRGSSNASGKDGAIIKVGKVLLWDKGTATTPRAIVKRPSTRDLRSSQTSWRRVSCILQDNGEFKLMTENDVAILSVIELSQLSRCAIQQLDKSVLDEEFCIAIFPIYSSLSTQLSIFRPVYLALDSRVLFEVWFVLLRAFCIPDIYAIEGDQVVEVSDLDMPPAGEIFRVEKTINLRLTEARIRSRTLPPEGTAGYSSYPHAKGDPESLVGNYLADVILDGEVRARTTTKIETKNPFWREDCEFTDLPAALPFLSIVLKRIEGNMDGFGHQLQASLGLPRSGNLREVICGSVDIPLNHLERGKDHEQWLQIYDDRQQSVGTMLARVRHEELVVLLAKDYQPISELLHRFGSGLTAAVADAMPAHTRKLAELFLNIFQVSGSASEWLLALVEDEIDGIGNKSMKRTRYSRRLKSNESMESASDRDVVVRDMGRSLAGEANLLFRGNSLLTQALEFQMRRLGKEYLEEILADKIFEINELNQNCEVDPGKLQQGEDLQQHWDQLLHLTNEVWECIANSATRLPADLRYTLKYVRAVAEDRYGDFLRTVSYTSVSGFLFLRFICPAILNPKLFGLLRDHPRPRAQRTLTLMAKGLQALANLSTLGKKETWMDPMKSFLGSQRQSVKDFIDQVCAIPTERASVSIALPASYSTPVTILGRMPPPAREGFPALPYLIDHARNFAALVQLWTSQNLSEAVTYEGDLYEFDQLCRSLQDRANDCHARLESLRTAENASQLTEDQGSIGDALEHMSLGDSNHHHVWADNDGLRPPGSADSDLEPTGSGRFPNNRQVSGSSEASNMSGTVRSLRSGNRQAKKFLSGFMRKARGESPDASPGSLRFRERDRAEGVRTISERWHTGGT